MAELPDWFERGKSSQVPTHEQLLKLARKRTIFVEKRRAQPALRRKCDRLVEAGFLLRVSQYGYQIRERIQ